MMLDGQRCEKEQDDDNTDRRAIVRVIMRTAFVGLSLRNEQRACRAAGEADRWLFSWVNTRKWPAPRIETITLSIGASRDERVRARSGARARARISRVTPCAAATGR